MSLSGHFWTLAPWLARRIAPVRLPRGAPWRTLSHDDRWGDAKISGELHDLEEARSVVVLIHGLGGSNASWYVPAAAAAALRAGHACLRPNLRGADRRGIDIYHAGLTADVASAVSSEELRRYERIFLIGFSLGGHVVLRYVADRPDSRVAAAASICSPVDLFASSVAFDEEIAPLYRWHVLTSLKSIYAAAARVRDMPLGLSEVKKIRGIREWDDKIVAPRFGFAGAADYYESQSASRRLGEIGVPTLIVLGADDPMIPAGTVEPALAGGSDAVEVRWIASGGHVGFPSGSRLGEGASRGSVADQVVAWLAHAAGL